MLSHRFQVLFIAFITLGIFYPSLFSDFNSLDDQDMIDKLMALDSIDLKGLFLPKSGLQYYRPVLYLTFVLDRFIFLCEPSFMHLENVVIHLLSGLLVFFISRRLLRNHATNISPYPALFISSLFVLHPLNTEAVNWISGRTDLMAGLFVFLCFFLFLKGLDAIKYWGFKAFIWFFLSALSYLLGMLSKEPAVMLVLVLGLFLCLRDHYDINLSRRNKAFIMLPYILMAVLYFLLRYLATSGSDQGLYKAASAFTLDPLIKLKVIVVAIGFYMKKLFIPTPLNFAIVKVATIPYLLIGIAWVFIIIYLLKKRSLSSFFLLFSFSFILPALPVAIARMTWTPLAERYLYISTFGVAAFVVLNMEKYISRKELIYLILGLLIVLSGFITAERTLLWQSNLSFYEDAVRKSPDFAPIRNEYGIALSRAGRTKEGLEQFLKASELSKGINWQPELNLLEGKLGTNKSIREKKQAYIKALERPNIPKAVVLKRIISLIEAEMLKEKDEKAIKGLIDEEIWFLESLTELDKKEGYYNYRLGQLYMIKGMKEEARREFKEAVRRSPSSYFTMAARRLAEKLKSN